MVLLVLAVLSPARAQSCIEGTDTFCLQCNLDAASTSYGACARCVNSYTGPKNCLPIKSNITNCLAFNATSWCKECFRGFYHVEGACVSYKSDSRCAVESVTDSSLCLACKDQTFPINGVCDASKTANKCQVEKCEYCDSALNCLECQDGYISMGASCVAKSSLNLGGCSLAANSTYCIRCAVGGYNNKGVCTPSTNATIPWSHVWIGSAFMTLLVAALAW